MSNQQPVWSVLKSDNGDDLFIVDITEMQLEQAVVQKHQAKLRDAHKSMLELEGGAIANPDEERQVGHYWLRNPDLAPDPQISSDINACVEKIVEFASGVLQGKITPPSGEAFSHVVLVGIGGSALGPQLVYDALYKGDGLPLNFIDNTDPDGMARALDALPDPARTLFIVTSKSGGTRETYNGEMYVKAFLKEKGLKPSAQMVAVTQHESALHQRVQSEEWIDFFPLWDWVGGRTSVTSAVGLLPAALQGADVREFLRGARFMDDRTRGESFDENPALKLALSWFEAGSGRGDKNMVVLPYRDRLLLFSRYLQQLVMESLGKKEDLDGNVVHQGLAVYGNKGSTDQHAFVQQLRDGSNDFFTIFIDVLADGYGVDAKSGQFEVEDGVRLGDYLQGFFLGTRKALAEGGRISTTLTLGSLGEFSLGQLIALFERAVGYYATLINVNAYHQPGVEAGKLAAKKVVELQQRLMELLSSQAAGGVSFSELVKKLELEEAGVRDLSSMLLRLAHTDRVKQEGADLFNATFYKTN